MRDPILPATIPWGRRLEALRRLDAKAKRQLATAVASYKIHPFDEAGRITRSRLPKNEKEALDQINLDVDGAHHFRKLAEHARKQLGK